MDEVVYRFRALEPALAPSEIQSTMSSSSVFNSPPPLSRKDLRWDQVLDENDHQRVTEGNKQALLHEALKRLRSLRNDISQDEWKYVEVNHLNNATK